MPVEITDVAAQENFADFCDRAVDTQEPIIIHRDGKKDVVLVAWDEWQSLSETAHLLASPANAQRLLAALEGCEKRNVAPCSVDKLRQEMNLDAAP